MSRPQFLRPCLIGVVHVAPTPGSPRFAGDVRALLDRARRDAEALAVGCDDVLANYETTSQKCLATPCATSLSLSPSHIVFRLNFDGEFNLTNRDMAWFAYELWFLIIWIRRSCSWASV